MYFAYGLLLAFYNGEQICVYWVLMEANSITNSTALRTSKLTFLKRLLYTILTQWMSTVNQDTRKGLFLLWIQIWALFTVHFLVLFVYDMIVMNNMFGYLNKDVLVLVIIVLKLSIIF